jgi:hypothetical protein
MKVGNIGTGNIDSETVNSSKYINSFQESTEFGKLQISSLTPTL